MPLTGETLDARSSFIAALLQNATPLLPWSTGWHTGYRRIVKHVPRADLDKDVAELAKCLAEKSPMALKAVKEAWYYSWDSPPEVTFEISNLISDRTSANTAADRVWNNSSRNSFVRSRA